MRPGLLGYTSASFRPSGPCSLTGVRRAGDHPIVDEDSVPALADVQRSSNLQIRWSVEEQVAGYAALAARPWTAEDPQHTLKTQPPLGSTTLSRITSRVNGAWRRGGGWPPPFPRVSDRRTFADDRAPAPRPPASRRKFPGRPTRSMPEPG